MEEMNSSMMGAAAPQGEAAPKGKRILAAIFDLVIVPIILGIVFGLLLVAADQAVRNVILILVNAGWLIFRDVVYAPGKAMAGIKLVSASGGKVTIGQAVVRNLLLMVPFVLLVGYIVEMVMIFVKGERLGDKWAKAQVIVA